MQPAGALRCTASAEPLSFLSAGLAAGRNVVLVSEIPADAAVDRLALALSPDERARAARIAAPEARRAFLAGRALLAQVAAAAGLQGAGAHLHIGEHGKPRFAAQTAPFVSVSHCAGWVAVAAGVSAEIGVDVEARRPLPEIDGLSHSVMSPGERARLARASDPVDEFLRLWTRKEAVVKALGVGIDHRFQQVDVSDARRVGLPCELRGPCAVADFEAAGSFVGAFCALDSTAEALVAVCAASWADAAAVV
ncbi:MAG TPA: 4'-phosphopantetheinyl transferase superfamily protein [Caulobacteraceae bacterium]|jgi:4'-phosphopantetheinyl transferase